MDTYGPPLPPGFKLPTNEDSDSDNEQPKKKAKVIGPERPLFIAEEPFEKELNSPEPKDESQASMVIGPVLPGTCLQNSDVDHDDDDSDVYGPLPPQTKQDYDIVKIIEKRAVNMKNKLDMKDIPAVQSSQREEWMVVPDTSRRNQLGAISRCLAPGSKIAKKETDYRNPEEDEKTSEELKKYNESKRNKSLLEMHQKKKKEKKPERQERKAFDRDEIATRHFNKKQVNSVIDKAKYLNSRFAPGRSNQYL